MKKPLLGILVVVTFNSLATFATEFRAGNQFGRAMRATQLGIEFVATVQTETRLSRERLVTRRTGVLGDHLVAAAIAIA